ncbi:MAG: integration host factor subunit beta [gamma proteobacterium symbiont of Taylorina sp.]|nr:integration host factor subunit beta [gamma proteobacterium symbiont of Taylorina sp.]
MTKSELIDILAEKHRHFPLADVKSAIDVILEHKIQSLASGNRIEIRGFGSFNLRYQTPRTGRNPKTGEEVSLPGRYKTHFKPGKELRDRVDSSVN